MTNEWSFGTDTVYGDDGDDTFELSADNDVLDGGAGSDLISLAGLGSGVALALGGPPATLSFAGTDTLYSVDLEINIVDAAGFDLWLAGWSTTDERVDQLVADGRTLVSSDVDQLVQARATFTAANGGVMPA